MSCLLNVMATHLQEGHAALARKEIETALNAYSKAIVMAAGDERLVAALLCNQAAALVAAKRCPDALAACMQVAQLGLQSCQEAHLLSKPRAPVLLVSTRSMPLYSESQKLA